MRIEIIFFIAIVAAGISLGIASIYKPVELIEVSEDFCQTDEECVPSQCCHPTSCVNEKYKPNCEGVFCTQVCQGPLDCGSGACKCISNKCEIVPRK